MAWFGLAMGLVILLMLLYLQRIDLVLCTLLSIGSGFLLAYVLYYLILDTPFFPFINILGLLVLIAIGADDVFVFFDMFEQVSGGSLKFGIESDIQGDLGRKRAVILWNYRLNNQYSILFGINYPK